MDEREVPDYPGARRAAPEDAPGGFSRGPDARWGIPLIFLAVIAALWLSFRLVPDLGALVDDLPLRSAAATPTLTISAVADATPTPGVSRPQIPTPTPGGQAASSSATRSAFVPNVIQSAEERAVELLKQHELTTAIEQVFDDTVARGLVVSQWPEPNASVPVGSTIIIRISKGPASATMPDVVGQPLEHVREQLTLLGVTVVEIVQASATEAAGIVLAQDPPADTQLEADSTVQIIVSAGADLIPAPDVRGKYFAFAQQELAGLGLRGVEGIKLTNDPGTCGTVASQNPEPGAPVAPDTVVRLNVRGTPGCTPP